MCAWCQKIGVKRYSLSMGSELKSFCSEKCFAACRRAYFKRNKVKVLTSQWLDTELDTVILTSSTERARTLIGYFMFVCLSCRIMGLGAD